MADLQLQPIRNQPVESSSGLGGLTVEVHGPALARIFTKIEEFSGTALAIADELVATVDRKGVESVTVRTRADRRILPLRGSEIREQQGLEAATRVEVIQVDARERSQSRQEADRIDVTRDPAGCSLDNPMR